MIKPYILLVILSCTVFSYARSGESPKTFQAEDVFELEYANDPRISPDGKYIVYERRSSNIMTDSMRSNIWIIKSDGTQHRPLVSGDTHVATPRWSPNADRLVYLQTAKDGTEIIVRWMDTGQTARIVKLGINPSSITWSPDGYWLAFTMPVKAESDPLAKPRKGPEGSEWSEPVKVFDAVRYKRDGSGFVETAYTHIFLVPSDGGTPRMLTSGNFNHEGPLSWWPDGSRLLFSANRDKDWEYESVEKDIYTVSTVDGELSRITKRQGRENMPVISPNGRYIAYAYDDGRKIPYRNKILTVLDLDGYNDQPLTEDLDRSVSDIQWAGNSRKLYFKYDDNGERKVGRVSLEKTTEFVLSDIGGASLGRPYLSGSYTVSKNEIIAYTHGTAQRPADVAIKDLRGSRVITSPGYESGKMYPLILEIHGGPHSSYGPQFTAELQRFAAEGYVVFYNNYRGSSGYGEKFALLLQYKYSSEEDFADHMSGVDELINRGIADSNNLFITGGSAGGIATAYAIGLTDRFRAAVVAKPVINWVSKVLTADSYIYQIPYQFPGMPWDEYEHYWKRSPLSLVGNVTTPTMLITGEDDQRTPISETEQFYQALKLRKIDSIMVRVPGSSHGIAGRPSRLNAKVDNILAWFDRYRSID